MPPKQQSITLEQRKALRKWAHQQHPKPSQKSCIEWFQLQYNHKLSQSTVSESLSQKYSYLDNNSQSFQSRNRTGAWPEVEKILIEFQRRIDSRGGFTSGDILQGKAREIWHQLPHKADEQCPEFSAGWLDRFKKRYNIKQHNRHGEADSIPESAEIEMRALQTIAGEYEEDNIYNMDETGLFWRMMPSRGLASQTLPGLKKDKTRISLVFCVNATGTDRFPVWFIGKFKTPRALRNINVATMGGQWRNNKKAWMTTTIMCEWLQAFYQHIGTIRQVLFTMDNFSAHTAALQLYPPPPNIRMCWLPAHSTSRYQPLDQGIINSFKGHYRRQWLQYMLKCFNQDQNPHDTMNLHLAIRWSLRAWNNHITNTTIYNCFRKSTLLTTPIMLPTPIEPCDIHQLYEQVLQAGNIHDQMTISNFLNPEGEGEIQSNEEEVEDADILQEILEEHLGVQQIQRDDDDDEESSQPVFTLQAARQALQVLIGFTENQGDLKTEYLRGLERLEGVFEALELQSLVQGTLDGWIT